MPASDPPVLEWPTSGHGWGAVQWGQTRRNKPDGNSAGCGDTVALAVFFSGKRWIVRFLPCLGPLQPGTVLVEDGPERLDADRLDNPGDDQILLQLLQRPDSEGTAQKFRRSKRNVHDLGLDFFNKFYWSAAFRTLPHQGEPFLIEAADQVPHVFFVHQRMLGDLLDR